MLLGNGDGTFRPAVTYPSGGSSVPPFSSLLKSADVNGDGRPDLIVENSTCCRSANGAVGVLLGNGDGTFQPVVTYQSGAGGWGTSVVVADVNSDSKLDVVATDQCASANCINTCLVAVLLGNGDGTFQETPTYDSGGFLNNFTGLKREPSVHQPAFDLHGYGREPIGRTTDRNGGVQTRRRNDHRPIGQQSGNVPNFVFSIRRLLDHRRVLW